MVVMPSALLASSSVLGSRQLWKGGIFVTSKLGFASMQPRQHLMHPCTCWTVLKNPSRSQNCTQTLKILFPTYFLWKILNGFFFNFKIFLKYNFIYLFLAMLGLCCCTRAFSSCCKWGLLLLVEHRLWDTQASVAAVPRLWSSGSVVVACGLSCFTACGIFLVFCFGRQILYHWATWEAPFKIFFPNILLRKFSIICKSWKKFTVSPCIHPI